MRKLKAEKQYLKKKGAENFLNCRNKSLQIENTIAEQKKQK